MKKLRVADERGQLLILTAVGLVMLLSVAALSVDASFMYAKRNKLHAAADAAAKTAAIEVHRYTDPSTAPLGSLYNFATQQMQANGFSSTTCAASGDCILYHPPATGPFTCANAPLTCQNYVEVIVSELTGTFFGG